MSKRAQGSVKNKIVASELVEERANGRHFDKEEMGMAFWKWEWVIDKMRDDFKLMEKHPIMANTHKFYDSTKHEIHRNWMKKINFMANLDRSRFVEGDCHPLYTWGFWHQG